MFRRSLPALTISEYIGRFLEVEQIPGEHHFVAAFLMPLLSEALNSYPLTINTDGRKQNDIHKSSNGWFD